MARARLRELTVAKALQKIVPAKLLDNHAVIDFAKTVFDFGAPGFWELAHSARILAVNAAARYNIPILICTGCYSEPDDRQNFEEIEKTILCNGGRLLPVFLSCSDAIREQRVGNQDRIDRRKISSIEGLRKFGREWSIAPVPSVDCLHLNSEQGAPKIIAAKIAEHIA